jgi:hypothetical protein
MLLPARPLFFNSTDDCYLWKDVEISNIEEGRALNSWLIGLKF